jgi:hypothetical protein
VTYRVRPLLSRRLAPAIAASAVLLITGWLGVPASSAAGWTPVTGPTPDNSAIGQVRAADGRLHVAWQRTSADGSTQELLTAAVDDRSGTAAVSPPVTIAAGFPLAGSPGIVAYPDGNLEVFFGGYRCADTSTCPVGLYTSVSTDGGATWSAPVLSVDNGGNYTADVNAALLSDGTPFETWWNPSITVHRGTDATFPAQDYQPTGGGLFSNLAADGAGHLELAWDSSASGNQGVFAEAVDPATGAPLGTPQRMPGTVTTINGSETHLDTFSRTPITAVPGRPGVFYTAYPVYTDSNGATDLQLWQVGAATTQTVAFQTNFFQYTASVAADDSGRVWVFWIAYDPLTNAPEVLARRLGPDGLETPVTLGAPDNAQAIYAVDGAVAPSGDPVAFARTGLSDGTIGTYYSRGPQTGAQNGRSVGAAPVSGVVLYKPPGSKTFVPLPADGEIPVGSTIDVTKGKIRLTAAKAKGGTETGDFSAGAFVFGQHRGSSVADLRLAGGKFGICGRRSVVGGPLAAAARRHRKVRALLGSGKGSFRTKGRYAAATVRGTIWQTEDDCDGTKVTVRRGVVAVTDLVRHKTVNVRAGHSYFAAAH